MNDDMLDYAMAESLTGLPAGTLRSLVAQQRLPHFRFGPRTVRFARTALEDWVRAHQVDACKGELR